jgi:hypothetical protein
MNDIMIVNFTLKFDKDIVINGRKYYKNIEYRFTRTFAGESDQGEEAYIFDLYVSSRTSNINILSLVVWDTLSESILLRGNTLFRPTIIPRCENYIMAEYQAEIILNGHKQNICS